MDIVKILLLALAALVIAIFLLVALWALYKKYVLGEGGSERVIRRQASPQFRRSSGSQDYYVYYTPARVYGGGAASQVGRPTTGYDYDYRFAPAPPQVPRRPATATGFGYQPQAPRDLRAGSSQIRRPTTTGVGYPQPRASAPPKGQAPKPTPRVLGTLGTWLATRIQYVDPSSTPGYFIDDNVDSDQVRVSERIRDLEEPLNKETSTEEEKAAAIQKAQQLVLEIAPVEESDLGNSCRLIIGVDATPATQAGYIINLKEKRLQYYVIKGSDFPWSLHSAKDTAEFEMKNFMFALTLWKDEILKHKRLRIYTDNHAINQFQRVKDKYGGRAFKLINHYQTCEQVLVLNWNTMVVNKFKNLENFARYIQPADDLSRWQINKSLEFLTELYGIQQENVHGTHAQQISSPRGKKGGNPSRAPAQRKVWYKPTPRYKEVLRTVKHTIDNHHCSRLACSDVLSTSIRIPTSSQA